MRCVDLFQFQAVHGPQRLFATDGTTELTYEEAYRRALRVAAGLREAGLSVGDHAAILAANSVDFAIYYLGCGIAGCVPTPLNVRLVGPELAYILRDSASKLIVADAAFVDVVEAIRGELPELQTCVVIAPAAPAGWITFDEWLPARPAAPSDFEVSDDVPALQVYTSGTTGRPKGVMMSHGALGSYALQQASVLERLDVLSGKLLVVAPMFHAGITMLWFTGVAFGGSMEIHRRFVPEPTVTALRDHDVAWTLLIPAMIQSCLVDVPGVRDSDFSSLRLITYGGSSIAEATLRGAIETFRCEFLQLYGLTETNAIVNLLPDDHRRALATRPELLQAAGRALAGCDLRIVSGGVDLAPNEMGEIVVRGPQLMSGYWNNPTQTAEAIRDGWFYTGDVGRLDEEGFLYVSDRIKDMIVSGGENVYSREVENVLFDHPDLVDAAVIGVPDERWGEAVKAIVVLRPGVELDADGIVRYCRERLAGFKCPKSIEVVDELPRNPSGKVLKRELRAKYELAASAAEGSQ